MRHSTSGRRLGWATADAVVIVAALLPVAWILSLSVKTEAALKQNTLWPSEVTLDNYRGIFQTSLFTRALVNSIGIAVLSTLVSVVLASMAAYAIARLDFPGKRLLVGASLTIAIFPQISLISPIFNIWRAVHLYDTWPGLILPYLTFSLPLAIYTLSAFFREIPWELEQAAQMDGATPFQAFRKVMAPLAAPGVFTTAILVFIFAWNDFLFAISLTSTDSARTVPAALAFFSGASEFQQPTGSIAAAAMVVTVPIIIMVLTPAPSRDREGSGVAEISLRGITKRYPDGTEAVKRISLDIADGEFMILVGPSGCGKSTALRMIAGLEDISEGELRIGGELVNDRAPRDRDIAMVFQNYALYPHMTVRRNMGFALELAGVDRATIRRKVEEAAAVLDLTQQLERKPANLSGGQRQRVAMGRAIVREPKAFLMDEPLSNLDAKLRVQMRTEVSRLQRRLGTTTVYVTHDQTEAMTLGDQVAVMRGGVIQQVGAPETLYRHPVNLFVGGFIGSPSTTVRCGSPSARSTSTTVCGAVSPTPRFPPR